MRAKRDKKAGAANNSLLTMWKVSKDDGNADTTALVPSTEAPQPEEQPQSDVPNASGSVVPPCEVSEEPNLPNEARLVAPPLPVTAKPKEAINSRETRGPIRATRSRSRGSRSEIPSNSKTSAQQDDLFSIFVKKPPSSVHDEPVAGPSTVAEIALAATKAKPKRKALSRIPSRQSAKPLSASQPISQTAVDKLLDTTKGLDGVRQETRHVTPPPRSPASTSNVPLTDDAPVIDVDLLTVDPPSWQAPAGSQTQPIIVESSPVKAPPVKSSTSSASFFAPRKTKSSQPQSRKKMGEGSLPSWPSGDFQHVGHSTRVFQPASIRLHRRNLTDYNAAGQSMSLPSSIPVFDPQATPTPVDTRAGPSVSSVKRISSPEEIKARLNASICGVGSHYHSAAALSRFQDEYDSSTTRPQTSLSNQEPWTEKWHPRKAVEVLTNESTTTFLRDWLRVLAVHAPPTHGQNNYNSEQSAIGEGEGDDAIQKNSRAKGKGKVKASGSGAGVKRPNVIRVVDKTRRRKRRRIDSDEESLDDWMVDDDDEILDEKARDEEEEDGDFLRGLSDLAVPDVDADADESGPCGSPWKPRLTRLSRKRPPDSSASDVLLEDAPNIRNTTLLDIAPPTSSPVGNSTAPIHDFSSHLTNSILLTGPPGSGKTAAVYACAEELGWEVFEVYPGIGKRNGASLASLVGDVGKNHIVAGKTSTRLTGASGGPSRERQMPNKRQKLRGFDSFFSLSKTKVSSNAHVHTDSEDEDTGSRHTPQLDAGFGFLASGSNETDGQASASARQSIILLEEVDVLFGEDAGFWPMVVNLIKDSRRPVIMTCNDVGLVPVRDLPLQATLSFEGCPDDIALTYLECVALSEGYAVTRDLLADIHKPLHLPLTTDTSDDLMLNGGLNTNSLPVTDVRRSINQLEYLCKGCSGNTVNDDDVDRRTPIDDELWDLDQLQDWECCVASNISEDDNGPARAHTSSLLQDLTRMSDALSAADSHVRRRPESSLEAFTAEGGSSFDSELGHRRLAFDPDLSHLQGGIPFYNCDEGIALEAARCAREAMRRGGRGTIRLSRTGERRSMDLLQRRSRHFSGVSDILGRLVVQDYRSVVARGGEVFLDYEPWVRYMVDADDLLEAADARQAQDARALNRGGRMTRNSQRESYVRYVTLSDEQRRLVHDTAFRVDNTLLEVDRRESSTGDARQEVP